VRKARHPSNIKIRQNGEKRIDVTYGY